jgi:hypothetical protein
MINSNPSIHPGIQNFINSKNLSMLWEVLLDELHINTTNPGPIFQNIKTIFESNVNLFKVRANPNAGLMNLNKQFLNQLLIAVNQLFPNLKQEQQMKRINISEEVIIDEPYKVEDIQSARQSDFEKQLTNKRTEFENSINGKKPKPIDFSDKVEPELKITEMEALIAETMAKRKFDIEQLQGHNQNSEKKSSIKKPEKTVSFDDNITYSDIDNNNIITTFKEENEKNEENIINTNNIFSKLKKNQQVTQPYTNFKLDKEKEKEIKIEDNKIQLLEDKIDKISKQLDIIIDQISILLEKNKTISSIF